MRMIYKYLLKEDTLVKHKMPKGAKILCVQVDQKTGTPCIWAHVNPVKESEEREFEIIGTGIPFESGAPLIRRKYIGTFQIMSGLIILHVFERIKR